LDESVNRLAEENLLGVLILQPTSFREIKALVSSSDFANADMGKVFDGISQMIARGQDVDQITVANRLSDWGVRLYTLANVFEWCRAEIHYTAAMEYATAVRNDSIKRKLREAASDVLTRLSSSENPLDVAIDTANMIAEIREGVSTGEIRTRVLGEILEGEDSYDWLIPGLLERQDRLIVTGPEGFGKTTFIRQLTILAAAGINPITFERIKPIRVLVIDAENTERQWRRAVRYMTQQAARIGVVDPRRTIHIAAGRRIDLTKGSHLSEIHNLVDVHKPDILMIGPLYKLVPKAINNDDDATPLIVALDSLRDRGLSLIMEAHAGKTTNMDGDRDLRPRGSAALLGWPEFGFGLKPVPTEPNKVHLSRWRGDRDGRNWPKVLVKGGEWPWMPEESFVPFREPDSAVWL
jgi:hypothetical protein